jgi:hypothetical protein
MVVEKKNGTYVLLCDTCGKITSFKDMEKGGGSWKFIPESDVSTEETLFRCKKCTDRYGNPASHQAVKEEMCCGVY